MRRYLSLMESVKVADISVNLLEPPPDLAAEADDLRAQIEALQAAASTPTTAQP